MALTSENFIADAAAIFIDDPKHRSFGSGRLIAPGLVLTARHVVELPKDRQIEDKWNVRLVRDRDATGVWKKEPFQANVVWQGTLPFENPLDLALLQVVGEVPLPTLDIHFASYSFLAPLDDVDATGYPEARWDAGGRARDYTIRGTLANAEQGAPFDWSISLAKSPDNPKLWVGMSGAVVAREGEQESVYLFGAVQEVPSNFKSGLLRVARLSDAFNDPTFQIVLRNALGKPPRIQPWLGPTARQPSRSDGVLRGSVVTDIRARIRKALADKGKEEI